MRARTRRLYMVVFGILIGLLSLCLMTFALRAQANLFYTPSLLETRGFPKVGKRVNIGGYVQPGSVKYTDTGAVEFTIEDAGPVKISVYFLGVVPDLFQEGQGVMAAGVFTDSGQFRAQQVLAKHDEYYAPPGLDDVTPPNYTQN